MQPTSPELVGSSKTACFRRGGELRLCVFDRVFPLTPTLSQGERVGVRGNQVLRIPRSNHQGGFEIGARTAMSARFWLHIKLARTRLPALLFPRYLNPRCPITI